MTFRCIDETKRPYENSAMSFAWFDFCPLTAHQMIGMIKSSKKAAENGSDTPAPSSLVTVSEARRTAVRTTHIDQ